MTNIHASHRMKYVSPEMIRVCVNCTKCYCHHTGGLGLPCEKAEKVRIPVFYNFNLADNEVVGYATIDDKGEMTIKVPTGPLVERLEHLATVDQIVAIAVGVNYRMIHVVKPKEENDETSR